VDTTTPITFEIEGAITFFRAGTNLDPSSPGYGLTVDAIHRPQIASIASVGFALSAWVIAVERGLMRYADALHLTRGTLRTLYERVPHQYGFFAHFLDRATAARWGHCEYSTIDTGLCLNGVLTAAAYFRDAEIEELTERLLDRIDWNAFLAERDGHLVLRMSYNPDADGDYVTDTPGFISFWDMAAEQKLLYLQAALRLPPVTARALYQGFRSDIGYYQGQPVIINPGGTLFAYQYTEAWLDTRSYRDPDGIDWFRNAQLAALANRDYCLSLRDRFGAYHERSWGIGCGDTPRGYVVAGAPPALIPPEPDGTVSISNALSCMPYMPDAVLDMLDYLYHKQPDTQGPYGFYDAYNLSTNPPWYSRTVYGINKGCALLMLENACTGLIWDVYTSGSRIQHALNVLGFTRQPSIA